MVSFFLFSCFHFFVSWQRKMIKSSVYYSEKLEREELNFYHKFNNLAFFVAIFAEWQCILSQNSNEWSKNREGKKLKIIKITPSFLLFFYKIKIKTENRKSGFLSNIKCTYSLAIPKVSNINAVLLLANLNFSKY